MRHFTFAFAFCAALAGCDTPRDQAEAAPARSAAPRAAAVAADSSVIPGTPAGDLDDWIRDIRSGIAGIPTLAATDPAAAQSRTLDLYVTRQEYAEMYFGIDGRQRQSDELAAAIEAAEARFHVLMKLLSMPQPSIDEVRSAVAALDDQQALVSRLWRQTGGKLHRTAGQ